MAGESNNTNYFQVEKILGERCVSSGRQFLIKWKNYDSEDNSWEPEANLTPDIVLSWDEDKKLKREKNQTAKKKTNGTKRKRIGENSEDTAAVGEASATMSSAPLTVQSSQSSGGSDTSRSSKKRIKTSEKDSANKTVTAVREKPKKITIDIPPKKKKVVADVTSKDLVTDAIMNNDSQETALTRKSSQDSNSGVDAVNKKKIPDPATKSQDSRATTTKNSGQSEVATLTVQSKKQAKKVETCAKTKKTSASGTKENQTVHDSVESKSVQTNSVVLVNRTVQTDNWRDQPWYTAGLRAEVERLYQFRMEAQRREAAERLEAQRLNNAMAHGIYEVTVEEVEVTVE